MNMIKYVAVLAITLFTLSDSYTQTCVTPPLGSDECTNAPLLSCNLDGYVGTTAPFTAGTPPLGFCGIIENNQYLSFVADESPIILEITSSNCDMGKGIQSALYQTSDCSLITPVTTCFSPGYETTTTLTVNSANVGETYYIMVDGFEGDICDFTINVVSGILPDVEAVCNDTTLCLGNSLALDASGSSTGLNVAYYWTASNGGNIVSGENTLNPIIDNVGDYELLVLDTISCCSDIVNISVTENTDFPFINIAPPDDLNCANPSIQIDASSSESGAFSFAWSTSNGNITSAINNDVITIDLIGDYNLTLTNDLTGCSSTETVNVQIDTISPILNTIASNPITCSQLSTLLTTSSNTPIATYSWTGPNSFSSNEIQPTVVSSGTYNLSVIAENECVASTTVEVIEDQISPILTASLNGKIDCNNPDVLLIANSSTAGVSYAWQGPNTFSSNFSNVQVNQTGNYLVTATAPNGCTKDTILLVEDDLVPPSVSLNTPNTLNCAETSVNLVATSNDAIQYNWTQSSFNDTGASIWVSDPGIYTLTATADNGCTTQETVTIAQNITLPTASAGANPTLSCSDTNVQLDGSASSTGTNFEYTWTNSNAVEISNVLQPTVVSAGIYQLEVLDNTNGCTAISDVEVLADVNLPLADASVNGEITCINNNITLDIFQSSVGGNISYEWYDANNNLIGTNTTELVNQAGTYSLVVNDIDNGCSSTDIIEVVENLSPPSITIDPTNKITCNDALVTISPALNSIDPNYTYEWLNELNTTIASTSSTQVNQAGSYELIITDNRNGCTSSDIIEVEDDLILPVANAGTADELTCAVKSVDLDGSNSSTGDIYTHIWHYSNGVPFANTVGTSVNNTDTYELLVTNIENGCTANDFVTVNEDITPPNVDAGNNQTLSCSVSSLMLDGSNSDNGILYEYEWLNSEGNQISDALTTSVAQADDYQLIITNTSNGCTADDMISILADINAPTANAGTASIINCTNTQAILNGQNSSTGASINYAWYDASNTLVGNSINETISDAGMYTLVVSDSDNGCSSIDMVEITEDTNSPTVSLTNPQMLTCARTSVSLEASSPNSYAYQWYNEQSQSLGNVPTISVNEIGTYTLIVTDINNGCSLEEQISVQEDVIIPVADANLEASLTCATNEVNLSIGNSSSGASFAYEWMNDQGQVVSTNTDATFNEAGLYSLAVMDINNGCADTTLVSILANIAAPVAEAGEDGRLTCTQESIALDGSLSTSVGNIDFRWENEQGNLVGFEEFVIVNTPGLYRLKITDLDNGCVDIDSVKISEDKTLPTVDVDGLNTITCTNTTINITSNTNQSNVNYIYQWLDENNNNLGVDQSLALDSAGIYQLIVEDTDNGCTQERMIEIDDDLNAPTIDAGDPKTLTCAIEKVDLEANLSDNTLDVNYTWQTNTGMPLSSASSITVSDTGMYFLIVEDNQNGCTNLDSVQVMEDRIPPEANLDQDEEELTCSIDIINLNGNLSTSNEDLNYSWFFDNQLLSTSPQLEAEDQGEYVLIVENQGNACRDTIDVFIDENVEVPQLKIGPTDLINCYQPTQLLEGLPSDTGNYTYQWTTTDGNIQSGEDSLNATVNLGGIYQLLIINEDNDCEVSEIVEVEADLVTPDVLITPEDELDCATEMVALNSNGSSTGNEFIYEWSGMEILGENTTPQIEIGQAGLYTLLITNTINGCSETADLDVQKLDNAPNGSIYLNTPDCFGDVNGAIVVDEVEGGAAPYIYAFEEGPFTTLNAMTNLEIGTYDVVVQDAIGCEWDTTVVIAQPQEVTVDLGEDLLIQLGESVDLSAIYSNNVVALNWEAAGDSLAIDVDEVEVAPLETTTYDVQVMDENGCLATDQIIVRVDRDRNVFIPNAFSPDGDGVNDLFQVYTGLGVKRIKKLVVFDRWGSLLFDQSNIDPEDVRHGWDGKFRNKSSQPNVYAYYVEIEFIDGLTEIFKGDFTLVK